MPHSLESVNRMTMFLSPLGRRLGPTGLQWRSGPSGFEKASSWSLQVDPDPGWVGLDETLKRPSSNGQPDKWLVSEMPTGGLVGLFVWTDDVESLHEVIQVLAADVQASRGFGDVEICFRQCVSNEFDHHCLACSLEPLF